MSSKALTAVVVVFCLAVIVLGTDVRAQATYSVSVTVQGIPPSVSTNLYVDGTLNGTLSGGQTRSFTFPTATTHIITVDYYLPNSAGANGVRYSNNQTSWVFSGPSSHLFTYVTEYYLMVETTYSTASGDGWYDSGSLAHASLKEGEIDEGQDTRHVFTGWTIDASGTGLMSNDIVMNGQKRAVAAWKTQFLLTIESDPPEVGNPNGAGWYDAGSQANLSVDGVVSANQDTRLRFTHWSGAFSGLTPSGSIVMDRPKVVKAHFLAQYLLSVEYNPVTIQSSYNETHTGWYDAHSNVQLGPAPTTIDRSSVERLSFIGWTDNGVASNQVSMTVLMDGPHKLILSYKTQYFLDVRSSYGSVSGSGWYDQGTTTTIVAVATAGTWPISYRLAGWRVDPPTGKLTKTDDSWTITVDRPYIVEAQWDIDYLPLIGILGGIGVAIAALAAGITLTYRRGMLRRGPPAPIIPPLRPTGVGPTRICGSCRTRIPANATFCQKCGASQIAVQPVTQDEKVYDYIVQHEGVISLSKAAKDLGISLEELKKITERLKKQGRLA